MHTVSRGTRAYYDESANSEPEHRWSPIVYFTLVIAVFTVIYAVVSAVQLFYTQRAYVRIGKDMLFLNGPYPGASIKVINFGLNPAFDVTDFMRVDIYCAPFPSGDNLPVWPTNRPMTLWPKEDDTGLPVHMKRSLADGEKTSILAGTEELYFWGTVKYRTFWIPRYTNFCFHTTGEASDASHIAVRACDEHNDAN